MRDNFYTIKLNDKGNQYIRCHFCNMRSFNSNDIEHKFCGNCNIFLDTFEMRGLGGVRLPNPNRKCEEQTIGESV